MPPTIGDVFPEDWKSNLAADNFKIGAVLKFYCNKAQKEKRFILMGFKYDNSSIALVHINTQVNINVFPTTTLQNEHVFFCCLNRSYLTHDSYIDCTNLIIRSKNEIFGMLQEQPSFIISSICSAKYFLVTLIDIYLGMN